MDVGVGYKSRDINGNVQVCRPVDKTDPAGYSVRSRCRQQHDVTINNGPAVLVEELERGAFSQFVILTK